MRHSDLIILGLLAPRPRHGYELVQEIDSMRLRQWARIGSSTVYVALERLEDRGHLESTVDREGNRPQRNVYAITDAGRVRLGKLVKQALGSDEPVYSDRLVGGVFAALALGAEAAGEALGRASGARRQAAERLEAVRPQASPVGRAIIDFQRRVAEAERRLLDDLAESPAAGERTPTLSTR